MSEVIAGVRAGWTRPLLSAVAKVRLLTAFVIFAAYELLARSGLIYEGVVPTLPQIARALGQVLSNPSFYPHLGITSFEVVCGFLIGTIAGVGVGITFGIWPFFGRTFESWIHYLASTPKIIFLPILFLFFGIGVGSKIAISAITSFFPVALMIYSAMRLVRQVLIRVMQTLNASRFQIIRMVYLPSLVAPALSSMRIALAVSIVSTLLAEIKLARAGLGYLIIQDYNFFRIPDMYALLIIVFVLAWAVNTGMELIASRIVRMPTNQM